MNVGKNSGFTLIELVSVVALIVVLGGLVATQTGGFRGAFDKKTGPLELSSKLMKVVLLAKETNAGVGCTNMNTASITAQNGGVAYSNTFGNAVTVTAAAANSITLSYPVVDAATATKMVAEWDQNIAVAVVNGTAVDIRYDCR